MVADEVRTLAERTTRATHEIGEMIKAIRQETGGAVAPRELGVKEVEKVMDSSRRSGDALQQILAGINRVAMRHNGQSPSRGCPLFCGPSRKQLRNDLLHLSDDLNLSLKDILGNLAFKQLLRVNGKPVIIGRNISADRNQRCRNTDRKRLTGFRT